MTLISKLRIVLEFAKGYFQYTYSQYQRFQQRKDIRLQELKIRGISLDQQQRVQAARESRCNHHKGGGGVMSVIQGTGTDRQFSVIKHQFANGDIWINCLRCGKKWKPGHPEYEEALKFQTINMTSSSIQFTGPEFKNRHREATKNS